MRARCGRWFASSAPYPATVFSSIDHQGSYAFGNQPGQRVLEPCTFAEALLPPLSDDPEQAIVMVTEAIVAAASRRTGKLPF